MRHRIMIDFFRPKVLVIKLAVRQPTIQPAIGVPLATEIQSEGRDFSLFGPLVLP